MFAHDGEKDIDAGQIISMGPRLGPGASHTEKCTPSFMWHLCGINSHQRSTRKKKSESWRNNIKATNGYHLKHHHAHTKILYSDASEYGYGEYVVHKLGNQGVTSNGVFTATKKAASSTHHGLLPVHQVLSRLIKHRRHESVLSHSSQSSGHRIPSTPTFRPQTHFSSASRRIREEATSSSWNMIHKDIDS